MNDLTRLGLLVNAMGGDSCFPKDDVIDLASGASYIPAEVTEARIKGEKVVYNRTKQEWIMPDKSIVK